MISAGSWGHEVYLDLLRLSNIGVFSSLGGCSLGTTSSSYVDITNASATWTKQGGSADTDVLSIFACSIFSTVATTGSKLAININGTDYDMMLAFASLASTAVGAYVGIARITGVAAGTWTVKARAKRLSGTGTVSIDGNGNVMWLVGEIPK